MKKNFKILFILISLFCFINPIKAYEKQIDIYLFHSYLCSHCKSEIKFLDKLKEEDKNLNITLYEIIKDKDNKQLLEKVGTKLNKEVSSVPFLVIGSKVITGYGNYTESDIRKTIAYYRKNEYKDLVKEVIDGNMEPSNLESPNYGERINLPIFGEIDPRDASLPLISIVIGSIDGFNPCAMWILLFLISMLIGTKDKKRMWVLGTVFLFTSAFIYLLFMLSWIKVVSFAAVSWIRLLIALVAFIGAYINLRSYFKSKNTSGCEVVSNQKRKKIFSKIKKFTTEKSLLLAIIGVMTLAISVNIIELACSAGLPLLFTQILAINNLSSIQYLSYVLIYIFFFLLDDLIVFNIAMFSLKITGISTKYTKYSHLIGGVLMLIIGILLVLKPEWLMFNF